MRTLSGTLSAAQKVYDFEPYVRVRVADLLASVRRLRMTAFYAGGEGDWPHGAASTTDGSLIRAYRNSGTQINRQRIAVPAVGSAWSTWTVVGAGAPASGTYVAVGAYLTAANVIIGWDNGTAVDVITSTDSGATWSAVVNVKTGGAAVSVVGAAMKSDGDCAMVWAEGATLRAARRTAGVWGGASSSGSTFATITGVSAIHDGSDWLVVVTGTETTTLKPTVWTVRWGDGGAVSLGTWEASRIAQQSDNTANVIYQAPDIEFPDVLRLQWVERWTGTGSYVLNMVTWAPSGAAWSDNLWREPVPLPTALLNGTVLAATTTNAYRTAAAVVGQSAIPSLSGTDYSSRVLRAEWSEPGRCLVELDNADGTLTDVLLLGSQLEIVPGYRTSAGQEIGSTGPYPTYWLDKIEHIDENNGRAVVVVEGGDVWMLLEAWQARRQVQYAAAVASDYTIIRQLAAYAGVGFALVSSSATMSAAASGPAFVLPAGSSAKSGILRLYRLLKDVPRQTSGTLGSLIIDSADASTYTYGPGASEHPIRGVTRFEKPVNPAFVRVLSGSAVGQAQDDTTLALIGDSGDVVSDRGISGATATALEAGAILRQAQIAAKHDTLLASPHAGAVQWDVVTAKFARIGWTSTTRRIVKIATVYDRRKRAAYEQTLTLGGV